LANQLISQHVSATEDATSNAEIRFRWLILAMACHDPSRVDAAIAMALEAIPRGIFVVYFNGLV